MKATRIVIAHRLSTVIKADRIIVLQDGRIVQDGNYKELIAVPGLFQDLATRQIA
jgi:ATP-binding cassette subfamily C protein